METIFEGLDSIAWSDLSHAYGCAEDVPGMLRAIISDDEAERREALYQLLGSIWHQGTIYEASSYVVPFLVRMLASPLTPDRASVALLLASIADGTSYLESHPPLSAKHEANWREILADEGKDFDHQKDLEREWVEAVRAAVEPHLKVLYEFIDHHEPELRIAVSSALGNYSRQSSRSIAILQDAISLEAEEYVREAMSRSIARLEKESGQG